MHSHLLMLKVCSHLWMAKDTLLPSVTKYIFPPSVAKGAFPPLDSKGLIPRLDAIKPKVETQLWPPKAGKATLQKKGWKVPLTLQRLAPLTTKQVITNIWLNKMFSRINLEDRGMGANFSKMQFEAILILNSISMQSIMVRVMCRYFVNKKMYRLIDESSFFLTLAYHAIGSRELIIRQ